LLPLLCGLLFSWWYRWSYSTCGKISMTEKILKFAIKTLMFGGILGLVTGIDLMLQLVFIR
jgi:hypothetical protein